MRLLNPDSRPSASRCASRASLSGALRGGSQAYRSAGEGDAIETEVMIESRKRRARYIIGGDLRIEERTVTTIK